MSSSESSVEMEGIGTENVSEGTESATTAAPVSVETPSVPSSRSPRASSNSQVSEIVVPESSSNSEACNLSPVSEDVFSNQSATNAILEELELMRPTYVFSEDTVRAEGMSSSYLASAIDFSSSCESEDDSDSCISPPASRSSLRRFDPIHGMDEIEYLLFRLSAEELNRPNMNPSYRHRRRRRAPYLGLRRNVIAMQDPTLYRI